MQAATEFFQQHRMVYSYIKNDDGTFVCPHCDYTANYQSTMHYHLKKHEDTKPHQCSHCDAKFVQKSRLDLHMRAKHPEHTTTPTDKEYFKCPCEGCGYKDLRKANLTIHFARIHLRDLLERLKTTPTSDEATCSCKNCHKEFKSMTHYYYHASSCLSLAPFHPMAPLWSLVR